MDRYDKADNWLSEKRELWDEFENILHNRIVDQMSGTAKSRVFDPVLPNLALDRSARVMAQVPTGKVKAISRNDEGASRLMNLTLDKYIIPNANAQFDFLTKCRMVDLYSNVYGNFFVLVDLDIKPNGVIAPDMFLINIRDVFPQIGAVSVEDSDYIIIRSWRTVAYFESLRGVEGFKNIDEIIEKLKDKAGDKQGRDSQHISQREQNQYASGQEPAKGQGYFEVLSLYERDRWVDFVPAAELEFRDRENPHDDGELPIVGKCSIPLIDDFMGMGDFERGKTMQYTVNSLWNLYLDGVKVSIFPPVMLDKNQIADTNSVKWSAAAKWLFKGNPANAAQVMNLSPQGTQTFNNVLSLSKTSLLSQFGTTDTATTQETDPGYGKTPQALKMQAMRENARDNVDRFYMEQFLKKVIKKMINIMSKNGEGVQIRMFEDEIDQLAKQYPEIREMWDENTGQLMVDDKKMGSTTYDYEIVSGSTYATDQTKQQENLLSLFGTLTNGLQPDPMGGITSPIIQALKAEGKNVKLGEMFTRILANSGIQDWDKIVIDRNEDPDAVFEEDMTKFNKILTQLGAGSDLMGQPSEDMMLQMQEGMTDGGGQQPNGATTQLL